MLENLTTYYKNASGSIIREILKVTQSQEVISFAGGLPNPKLFPKEEISKILLKLSENMDENTLQYATTEGDSELRSLIDKEQVLITDGSQQGLDLIAKIFIEKGDRVLVEDPSYLGAIQTFASFGAEIDAIALESDGLNSEILENQLQKEKYKFLYINPDFQNPSGTLYSIEKRIEIVNIAQRFGLTIVEDAPYKELSFDGIQENSFYELLPEQTIYLGSFSKIFAPAFRIGWIKANKEILQKLAIAKQTANLHTNTITQRIVAEYLKSGLMKSHIETITKEYKEKASFMAKRLAKEFGDLLSFQNPQGGMFIWATFTKNIDTFKLFEKCAAKGAVFVPGTVFYHDGRISNSMRLNFTNSSLEDIEKGVKILHRCFVDENK